MSRSLVLALVALLLATIPLSALEYATFIGNIEWDEANDVTMAHDGNVIAVGFTEGPFFPTTSGAYDESYNGDKDIFVTILSPDLSTLVASTYCGGVDDDIPLEVVVDRDNNIFVTGYTQSDNFPATDGAFDTSHNDPLGWATEDVFVIKMSAELDSLLAATYVGGDEGDIAGTMIIDQNNDIVVAGSTNSENFPVIPGGFDTEKNGFPVFIFKISNDLTTMIASTFVEGTDGAAGAADIVEDVDSTFLFTGSTNASDFPTTPGSYSRTLAGYADIVVFRMSSNLDTLLHSTYIGGSRYEKSPALALDMDGTIVVLGDTESEDFPSTEGVYDPTFNAHPFFAYADLVLFRFSDDLSDLLASTFIGCSNNRDSATDLVIDNDGSIVAVGHTSDPDFPTTADAYDQSFNGWNDVVLLSMSPDLSVLRYSTFVGGADTDIARAMVRSEPNGFYVTGYTHGYFPVTEGAYDMENGYVDGFLMKFEFPDLVFPGLVTGPGPGEANPPLVRTAAAEWSAYGIDRYGVNVACGDLDGDAYDEIITGAGPGAVFGPHVRGWNSDGSAISKVSYLAYGTHKFGVNVSCGDIDGDGIDEILTGAGPGAVFGPHVRGWNVDGGFAAPMTGVNYFAYGTLRWGVNVTSGDIDGDGFDEIVTGAGPGTVFGPHVRGWNVDGSGPVTSLSSVSFLAYGTNQWGVNVACGDLDGDGFDEIITGPGPGDIFGSHVRGWNYDGSAVTPLATVSYFAYPGASYGVVVSAFDVDGDGIDEILTMPGPDPTKTAHARAWNVDGGAVIAIDAIDFYPYPDDLMFGGRIAGGRFETGSE